MNDPDLKKLADRLEQNSTAISETQGILLKYLEDDHKLTTFDKFYRFAQLLFPAIIAWMMYYVSSEIKPVHTLAKQNSIIIREAKEERNELTSRLNKYDVKEARRDVVLENLQKDIREIRDILKNANNK